MNEYGAIVLPFDETDSYFRLRIQRGKLACHVTPGVKPGAKLNVLVRPSNVLLSAERPTLISARNILSASVISVKSVLEGVYVGLDAGFELYALVTRQAVEDLSIRKGRALFAIIKASSVEIVARVEVPFRVVAKGAHGDVDVKQIDLLRSIDINGSLTVAAKSLGVTYRTAWVWANAMNTAWIRPLLQTTHGGKGGGGAWLTPEGKALLEYVAKIEGSVAPG